MADDSTGGSRLRVSVVDAAGRPLRARSLAAWLARVAPRRARGTITVALVSDAHVRRLNRQYRGIDRPTDVLSFPTRSAGREGSLGVGRAEALLHAARRQEHLGDVVIARGVALRQARRARHRAETEWRILALHGLLHLLGYDHEGDNGRMDAVERRLRRKGGLPAGLIERGATA